MLSPKQRWMMLGGLLALTLLAIYLVQEPVEESLPQESSTKDSQTTKTSQEQRPESASFANNTSSQSAIKVAEEAVSVLPDLTQKHLFVEDKSKKTQDLFKGHAWYVPPPPPKPVPVKVEPPPPPAAPPVPFFYMGKLEQAPQATQVFLTANNKVLSVTVGKNVDTLWRLDKEEANTLTFTYLPLGLTKTLSKALRAPAGEKTAEQNNPDGAI
ncbi:hypothetical protein [Candidatus Methylopumilus turicensis]|uniref:Prolin-rich transmembrane protein n=1 Tax=Candidatus Methylopumilus turicensis TaxID=1581680 RepID=A0A0B7IYW8_9PROT|nr:hypothetical protein [Candidatus Methylopumilus turicensis]CEN56289.1 conserved exported protein of unknown function [Candidatus Methylopumilus turicensis]